MHPDHQNPELDPEFISPEEAADFDPEADDEVPPATLAERQPVRVLASTPTAVLGLASAIVALGVGEPLVALACAVGIVAVLSVLELVRARVTPVADPKLAEDVRLTPVE